MLVYVDVLRVAQPHWFYAHGSPPNLAKLTAAQVNGDSTHRNSEARLPAQRSVWRFSSPKWDEKTVQMDSSWASA